MKHPVPAIVDALLTLALASSFWTLAGTDPSALPYLASVVGAFLVVRAISALGRRFDAHRATQN
ncbi:hypothetical protein ABT237_12635 [Streptomyces sp. NPDC001581]|uniref:hypothetical protein n=1 Tax=Streptomyces sp. NPDC001581 TaxID=3154386 RepID=UPI003316AAC1